MRRIGRMLCLLLFMLWQGGESIAAEEEGTLDDLLRRAAETPAVDTYSAVCRFCYADGTHPAVLSAYADSLRQLGVRTRSARCFWSTMPGRVKPVSSKRITKRDMP